MLPTLITPIILLLLSPPFEPSPSTGPRRSTGARRETPPLKRDGGGICHAVVQSPAVTVARHARAHSLPLGPRTGPGHRRCRHPLPPARAEPHPPRLVLVPPGLDLRPPHPRQQSRKPPRRPPSLSPPTATATPTTSAASKPRGTSRRRTSGRGPPSPHRRRPRRPGRGGEGAQNIAPCRSRDRAAARWYLRTVIPRCHHRRQGLGGGERPQRRLPGAEVATEEAAAAVIIITCFVVGCGRMLCDWFVGGGR